MARKVLVIGLDGAVLQIIKQMAADGVMPYMAALMKNGMVGELTSTHPVSSAPAWASFMTGKNPGKHKIFDFINKIPHSYRLKVATSASIKGETLWDILGNHGKRSVVLNVPMTYPPKAINGVMIAGMLSPGEDSNFIYPEELRHDLKKKFGKYIIDVIPKPYLEKGAIEPFLKDLAAMTKKRCDTALYCLEKNDWDFFMVVFVGLDRLQHALWECVDLHSEDSRRHKTCGYIDSVRENYRCIDASVGRIVKKVKDDTDIFIISDHGFGPFYKEIEINNWLARNGFLRFRQGKDALKSIIFLLKLMGIDRDSVQRAVKNFGFHVDDQIANLPSSAVDWAKTKAFSFFSDGIYLNVKGREQCGIVEFPKEYERIRAEIIEKLLALKDPGSGENVIYNVVRGEDLYATDDAEGLPDLIIAEYDRRYVPTRCSSYEELGGSIFVDTKWHTGSHRPEGLYIGYGRNVKSGGTLKNAKIVDIMPTILSLLEIPAPKDIDGKILVDLLRLREFPACKDRDAQLRQGFTEAISP